MSKTKKQTFIKGAFILVAAGIIVKIIGAVFKIPLTNLIHEEGMGLFSTAYTIYTFAFIIATAGFPIAISKMVAESVALGNDREAKRIFNVSLVILGLIGATGCLVLYLFAQPLANALHNSRAALGIIAMSPAVFCAALTSVLRGYFQGYQDMYPTAISQVIEALSKLIVGYTLAKIFLKRSIELAAAGAIFGVSLGTFFSLFALIIIYAVKRNKNPRGVAMRSRFGIVRELIAIAVPITIGASVASLTTLIDVTTVMSRLQTITSVTPNFTDKYKSIIDFSTFKGGIDEDIANKLYGLYTGYTLPLFNMPFTIITALSISAVPAISAALAKGSKTKAKLTAESVIRITILFSLPCSAGLIILAKPILNLLFSSTLASDLLAEISLSITFVSLLTVTNAILQAYNKMYIPVLNMLLGSIIKIITNYFLIAIPSVNIDGAPVSTFICYGFIVILNIIEIKRETGISLIKSGISPSPLISVLIMSGGVKVIYDFISRFSASDIINVAVSIASGIIIYTLSAFLTGAVRKEELELLPKGDKILKFTNKKGKR